MLISSFGYLNKGVIISNVDNKAQNKATEKDLSYSASETIENTVNKIHKTTDNCAKNLNLIA